MALDDILISGEKALRAGSLKSQFAGVPEVLYKPLLSELDEISGKDLTGLARKRGKEPEDFTAAHNYTTTALIEKEARAAAIKSVQNQYTFAVQQLNTEDIATLMLNISPFKQYNGPLNELVAAHKKAYDSARTIGDTKEELRKDVAENKDNPAELYVIATLARMGGYSDKDDEQSKAMRIKRSVKELNDKFGTVEKARDYITQLYNKAENAENKEEIAYHIALRIAGNNIQKKAENAKSNGDNGKAKK